MRGLIPLETYTNYVFCIVMSNIQANYLHMFTYIYKLEVFFNAYPSPSVPVHGNQLVPHRRLMFSLWKKRICSKLLSYEIHRPLQWRHGGDRAVRAL